MILTKLQLLHFKNYSQTEFILNEKFILLNGANGAGKTNLIDAVYFTCMCKSYFTNKDQTLIQKGESNFRIDAFYKAELQELTVTCKIYSDRKKEILCNNYLYERLSEHIGKIPVSMITPSDIGMINGGSEERRKFLDSSLSQLDTEYLKTLIDYNRLILQRNALLTEISQDRAKGFDVLKVINAQLVIKAESIFIKRKKFIEDFSDEFNKMYAFLSDEKETPQIVYSSDLSEKSFAQLLSENIEQDIFLQRTTKGIHKDDLKFFFNDFSLKENGSQGQIKSFLICLKLQLAKMLFDKTLLKPILLLDDIFEKLDSNRMYALFELLKQPYYGQIFITDADENRSKTFCIEAGISFQHIKIRNGNIN